MIHIHPVTYWTFERQLRINTGWVTPAELRTIERQQQSELNYDHEKQQFQMFLCKDAACKETLSMTTEIILGNIWSIMDIVLLLS